MTIFEVGVGTFIECRTKEYINTNVQCYLFEPNPYCFQNLQAHLDRYSNFHLFNIALGSEQKLCNLFLANSSSFVEGISSPEKSKESNSENILQKVSIQMEPIIKHDNNQIDVLLLDVEGGEFDIISNLTSRPKQICVEMYSFGVKYKNPHFNKIMKWMHENHYELELVDNPWNKTNQPIGEDFLFALGEQ